MENLNIDKEKYDFVCVKGCGETEVWQHYETKEEIYVPVEIKRYWHLARKEY
tara:strand:+ start:33 stop:188 length:156 start_codon:yes stop_codon:yes gene_type:complete